MKSFKVPMVFEWDTGNTGKNRKHGVAEKEIEEVFFDEKKIIYKDVFHSFSEERFIILGKTKNGRMLYTVYTIRGESIRIISARDINRKEVPIYEKATQHSKV